MNVGLTYDLRADYLAAGYGEEETAEFDRIDTIEALESALRELGHATDRIGNAWQLVERLAAKDRWDLVFNIAEGLRGPAREAKGRGRDERRRRQTNKHDNARTTVTQRHERVLFNFTQRLNPGCSPLRYSHNRERYGDAVTRRLMRLWGNDDFFRQAVGIL